MEIGQSIPENRTRQRLSNGRGGAGLIAASCYNKFVNERAGEILQRASIGIREVPGSNKERAILVIPGALDSYSEPVLQAGKERGLSVFQVAFNNRPFLVEWAVEEILDHLKTRGVEKVDLLASSMGGILAMGIIHAAPEKGIAIRSFFGDKAALRKDDLNTLTLLLVKRIAGFLAKISEFKGHIGSVIRSKGAAYEKSDIPALFVVPPGGRDLSTLGVDYQDFFPEALVIEDGSNYSRLQKITTFRGHMNIYIGGEIQALYGRFLDNPRAPAEDLLSGLKNLREFKKT